MHKRGRSYRLNTDSHPHPNIPYHRCRTTLSCCVSNSFPCRRKKKQKIEKEMEGEKNEGTKEGEKDKQTKKGDERREDIPILVAERCSPSSPLIATRDLPEFLMFLVSRAVKRGK